MTDETARTDNIATSILQEAITISAGDTGKHTEHGTPERAFARLGEMWTLYLGMRHDPQAPISASEAAVMLALLKVCRMTMGTPTRDHFVDGANYLALAGEEALRKNVQAGVDVGSEPPFCQGGWTGGEPISGDFTTEMCRIARDVANAKEPSDEGRLMIADNLYRAAAIIDRLRFINDNLYTTISNLKAKKT